MQYIAVAAGGRRVATYRVWDFVGAYLIALSAWVLSILLSPALHAPFNIGVLASVEKYLSSKVGDALGPVSAAMTQLADSRDRDELAAEAYGLYEQFRPAVPAGESGWGAPGTLSLVKIRKLTKEK